MTVLLIIETLKPTNRALVIAATNNILLTYSSPKPLPSPLKLTSSKNEQLTKNHANSFIIYNCLFYSSKEKL